MLVLAGRVDPVKRTAEFIFSIHPVLQLLLLLRPLRWDRSREVGQYPGNESRANGTRPPGVTDDLICKRSFGGFGGSSHVNIVPLLNDFDVT